MTYAIVKESDGTKIIVSNAVKDSDGNVHNVSNSVKDSDGIPYVIFTDNVDVVRTVKFIAIPNRRFVA